MNPENFKQARKRLEERYRLVRERAEKRIVSSFAGALSPANQAIFRKFETSVAVIDSAIESRYRRIDDVLLSCGESVEAVSSALVSDARGVPAGSTPQLIPPDNPLGGLSVRTLHKLEKMDSYLRHSVVEICLNNLKMFAQLAPAKSQDENFVERVLRCIPAYPAVAREISLMFERALEDGVRLKDLFPAEYVILADNLSGIDVILEIARERKTDSSFWERFARNIPNLIEGVLGALSAVTAAITGIRVPVLPIIRAAVDLFRPRIEDKGILVNLFDKTDKPPAIFANTQALLNSFVELLRNAHKHAFGESAAADKIIEIGVTYPDRERRQVQIEVSDNGRGIPRDILPRLGRRGVSTGGSGEGFAMVESIIRREHLGEITVKSKSGKGTRIKIILPVKIDL